MTVFVALATPFNVLYIDSACLSRSFKDFVVCLDEPFKDLNAFMTDLGIFILPTDFLKILSREDAKAALDIFFSTLIVTTPAL